MSRPKKPLSDGELVELVKQSGEYVPDTMSLDVPAILNSQSVAAMTTEQVGAYVLLLMRSWMHETCSVTADDAALAMLTRLGPEWDGENRAVVLSKFFELGGRLYNRRLLSERIKSIISWQQKVIAANRSAKSRKLNVLEKRAPVERPLNERSQVVEMDVLDVPQAGGPGQGDRRMFIDTVFGAWQQAEGLIHHREMGPGIERAIGVWHGEYEAAELVRAVQNYSEVLTSDGYWWTHKFGCDDFFRRGSIQKPPPFRKFLDEYKPLEVFSVKMRDGMSGRQAPVIVDDDTYRKAAAGLFGEEMEA